MARKKEKDYEVAEVDVDIWVCDFCEREYEDSDDIHTFAVDPKVTFSSSRAGERLVWLNKSDGRAAVKRGSKIVTTLEGHICDECVRDADLSTGTRDRGYHFVSATLKRLGF